VEQGAGHKGTFGKAEGEKPAEFFDDKGATKTKLGGRKERVKKGGGDELRRELKNKKGGGKFGAKRTNWWLGHGRGMEDVGEAEGEGLQKNINRPHVQTVAAAGERGRVLKEKQ